MAASTKTWVDSSAPSCNAVDLNGFALENNNLIVGAGLTLNTSDNQQTHKAVAQYAAAGDFYVDSGTSSAIVLSTVGSQTAPTNYGTGMRIRWVGSSLNPGPVTVNVSSLGVVDLLSPAGNSLIGYEVGAGELMEAYCDGSAFRLVSLHSSGTWTPSLNTGQTWTYTTQTGTWVRSGNIVTFYFYINASAVTGTPSSSVVLYGMPTCVGSSSPPAAVASFTEIEGFTVPANSWISGYYSGLTNDMTLYYEDGASFTQVSPSTLSTPLRLIGQFSAYYNN